MPHFLATTVVTLLAGSVQPIPQMPLPQMNPQFNQGFTQDAVHDRHAASHRRQTLWPVVSVQWSYGLC